jgi:hypothetical protein
LPPALQQFWAWYEQLSGDAQLAAQGPVLNKIKAVTDRSALRNMVGQSRGLDVSEVLDSGKVLLVNLAKGRLGSETAALLGSLLVANVWEATLKREQRPANLRRPAMVTLDEFQDVLKLGTVGDMLAQSRGLGVGLQLAHQTMHQLPQNMSHAVLGTARTQFLFQLGYEDARALTPSVAPSLTADDLSGLEAHHAVLRPCVGGQTRPPLTIATLPLASATRDGAALAQASRQRLGVARNDIESSIANRLSTQPKPGSFGRSPLGGGA